MDKKGISPDRLNIGPGIFFPRTLNVAFLLGRRENVVVGNYFVLWTGCLLLFLTFHCTVQAQEVTELETITVTAEKFPVQEKESTRFVTVISADELEETGACNLIDALKRKGGFAYKAFGPLGISHGGMNSELSIRGLRGGELILINGAPIQGAAGHAYDLNTIPIDQIERVEILKGAASTLYGADAMTGVINIITKKNVLKTTAKASVGFGSHGYQNHGVSLLTPKLNLGLNYSHLDRIKEISRSFSKHYRYDTDNTDSYFLNLNANLIENLYFDYLGSFYKTGFKKTGDSGDLLKGTDQDHYKHFADIRYENDVLRLKAFSSYGKMKRDEYTSATEPVDHNKNYNYGVGGDYRFPFLTTEFVVGADYVYRGADYDNTYGSHHRNDYAGFLQIKKEFMERLIVTLGAREQFIDAESGGKDYDRFLPSLGLNYKASGSLNLFANAGKAFRAPSFNNLYYKSSFLEGNPQLGPEEGWTYEGGIKYDNDFVRLRLAAFYMTYEDKIEIDRSHGYPLTYFNAGDYKSRGVEWEIDVFPIITQASFLQNITLRSAGYWADPTAENVEGKDYQTGPKFQTSIGILYILEKITLDLNIDILTSRPRGLDDTAPLNFFGKFKLVKGHLILGVDNIFDEQVEITGDMTDTTTNKYAYYGIGRMFKAGYEIAF